MSNLIPLVGDRVMAQRYYNSKRIVWEPCIVKTISCTAECVKISVEWIIDSFESTLRHATFREVDPKWLERKIADLEKEEEALRQMRMNLKYVYHEISTVSK